MTENKRSLLVRMARLTTVGSHLLQTVERPFTVGVWIVAVGAFHSTLENRMVIRFPKGRLSGEMAINAKLQLGVGLQEPEIGFHRMQVVTFGTVKLVFTVGRFVKIRNLRGVHFVAGEALCVSPFAGMNRKSERVVTSRFDMKASRSVAVLTFRLPVG
jgi:hypothetical protein